MHSASQVGGDYYDILPMGKTPDFRSYLFCVADVAGKGLVASLLMSNFQSMLLTLIDESLPLAEIANRLSSLLQVVPRRSRYVTSVMVQLDVVTRVCHYVNAGHTSGILLRAEGDLEWLSSTGFPIGMFADCTYQSEAFQLYSGSLVALFSDGFTDALDANGQEFGEGRLVDYLRRACGKPAKDIVEGAFDEINRFIGSAPQFDDITLLVFKSTV
jgi:sigma-B regulation protein RsbU (phosphoserine phosphatase)